MPLVHSAIKTALTIVAVLVGLGVACVCFAVWQFGADHKLATLKLGEHQVRLKINYDFDVASDVLCELRGPKRQHPSQIIAFIGAGQSIPTFAVHQATNCQVFWITADTMPKTILYALDVETGEHWPPRESGKDGEKFLDIAGGVESGYRLYQHEWIGVKNRPNKPDAASPAIASRFQGGCPWRGSLYGTLACIIGLSK